jgi:ATP-dependent RNA helicase DHX57
MAPKKGQGNRGGGGPKKNASPASTADDSFIVFSNSKSEPKSHNKGKGPANTPSSEQDDVPKKPDTRKLIGGASWTGKLPVNLLSEHCQKQRWEKPEYTMVGLFHC